MWERYTDALLFRIESSILAYSSSLPPFVSKSNFLTIFLVVTGALLVLVNLIKMVKRCALKQTPWRKGSEQQPQLGAPAAPAGGAVTPTGTGSRNGQWRVEAPCGWTAIKKYLWKFLSFWGVENAARRRECEPRITTLLITNPSSLEIWNAAFIVLSLWFISCVKIVAAGDLGYYWEQTVLLIQSQVS